MKYYLVRTQKRGRSVVPACLNPITPGQRSPKFYTKPAMVPPHLSVKSRRSINFLDVSKACYQYRNSIESLYQSCPMTAIRTFSAFDKPVRRQLFHEAFFRRQPFLLEYQVSPLVSSSKLPIISPAEAKVVSKWAVLHPSPSKTHLPILSAVLILSTNASSRSKDHILTSHSAI